MSDAVDVEEFFKLQDQKLVDGFVRTHFISSSIDIPKDIIHLLQLFYHIARKEIFEHYDKSIYEVSDDGMRLTRGGGEGSVCYGSILIHWMRRYTHGLSG